jgi:Outer membrane protein beta-barrel domain
VFKGGFRLLLFVGVFFNNQRSNSKFEIMGNRNKLILVILGLILPRLGIAQVEIGIKAGTTLSTTAFGGTNRSNYSAETLPSVLSPWSVKANNYTYPQQLGVSFAVSAMMPIHGKWSLQGELQYNQKGYHERNSMLLITDETIEVNTFAKYTYIDLPILAKYTLKNGGMGVFVVGGVDLGYTLGGHVAYNNSFNDGGLDAYLSSANYNRLEVSAVGGLGLSYALGKNTLTLDTRYAYGLTNTELSVPCYSSNNRVISVLLGYQFRL